MHDDEIPLLEDNVQNGKMQQEGLPDDFDEREKPIGDDTIQSLNNQVDAMHVEANVPLVEGHTGRGHNMEPIIQFPEEEGQLIWRCGGGRAEH
jgi:hypothetical protein